jgi:hypothetical protein
MAFLDREFAENVFHVDLVAREMERSGLMVAVSAMTSSSSPSRITCEVRSPMAKVVMSCLISGGMASKVALDLDMADEYADLMSPLW